MGRVKHRKYRSSLFVGLSLLRNYKETLDTQAREGLLSTHFPQNSTLLGVVEGRSLGLLISLERSQDFDFQFNSFHRGHTKKLQGVCNLILSLIICFTVTHLPVIPECVLKG